MTTPGRPVVMLAEWQTVVRPDLALTDGDRALAVALGQGQAGRLVVEELRAGLRLRATSWVGLIRFAGFDAQVVPKLAGEHLGLVRLLEFAAGLPALRRLAAARTLAIDPRLDLFDLIALLFVDACDAVIRDGLLADYLEREAVVPAPRGRLLADRQLTRRFGRVDLLECRFDDWETDIPENQLLAAALAVCAGRVRDDDVRRRVRRLAGLLAGVCDLAGFDPRHVRETLVYTRLNAGYRAAHTLAWFLLDGLGVRDLLAPGDAASFAFLIDMNALFERFVWRAIDRLATTGGLRVHYQRRDRSILWDESAGQSYASVIPDLLVQRSAGGWLPIDAKYKQVDERRLSNEDIYQTFLYAFAYTSETVTPEALVIYPAAHLTPRITALQVRDQRGLARGRVRALGVHVLSLLAELRAGQPGPQTDALAASLGAPSPASQAGSAPPPTTESAPR